MACDSFENCVYDPLEAIPCEDGKPCASESFATLSSTAVFSINLTFWIFYIALIIGVVWFIFKGIYSIIGADSSESFEKFRGAITNSVFAALGIVLIFSARFIFVVVLGLFGIPYEENLFGGGFNALFGL